MNLGKLHHQIHTKLSMMKTIQFLSLFVISGFAFSIEKPNVLLIMVDDMNTMLSTYGHKQVKTPNLEKLKKEGVQFNKAYVQYPQCTASRTSMLTGLYPDQSGVTQLRQHFRNFVPEAKTLPQIFKEKGYYTARVGKIFHYDVPREVGTDGMDDSISWVEKFNPIGIDKIRHDKTTWLGPRKPNDKWGGGAISWMRVGGSSEEHTDGIATKKALELLKVKHSEQTEQPFFLAVGYFRPHVPFAAPEKFFDLYPREKIDFIQSNSRDREDIPIAALSDDHHTLNITDSQRKDVYQAYYASISFIDEEIGKLLNQLELLNLKETTIVIFVSDHGFLMGQHGLWQKKNLFEESVRTPLIISSPFHDNDVNESNAIIELVDLFPTILDLTGIEVPNNLSGKSFASIIDHPVEKFRLSALSQTDSKAGKTRPGFPKVKGYSIRTERFRYTEWDQGNQGAELYDHANDSEEIDNLIFNPDYEREKIRLKAELHKRIKDAQQKI